MAMQEGEPRIVPVGVDDLERASQGGAPDFASARVRAAERAAIESRRQRYGLADGTDDNLMGLALSGGGIRSATFALGVMQALAGRDLLKHVDYLSTVSGGGYIGTSLLWWLSGRSGKTFGLRPWARDVPENQRFPYGTDDPSIWRDRAGQADGPRLLRNLKNGQQSGLWDIVPVILREIILSLCFWIPLLTITLGILRIAHVEYIVLGLAVFLLFVFVLWSVGHGIFVRRYDYLARRVFVKNGNPLLISAFILLIMFSILSEGLNLEHQMWIYILDPIVEHIKNPIYVLTIIISASASITTFFFALFGVRPESDRILKVVNMSSAVIFAFFILLIVILCQWLALWFVENGRYWWGMPIALTAFVFSMLVNINDTSALVVYRDRLMELFMPAFHSAIRGQKSIAPAAADGMRLHDVDEGNGPFAIFNTNILLAASKERDRELRGGDSFIMTSRYCGSNSTGWVDCRELMDGRMTMSTAMAISGVLPDPQTPAAGLGRAGSKFIARFLRAIGFRFSYWIPNFGRDRPPLWLPNRLIPGVSGFWGRCESSWFLELSHGGQFDNLGLYELIRRRVRLIILVDANQDPGFAFPDLQGVETLMAADFGATLDLTAEALECLIPRRTDHQFPGEDLKLAQRGHAIGDIRYADGTMATLIYLKTTLIEGLPRRLLSYRGKNSAFPNRLGVGRFDEEFEAYRELGFRIADAMMRDRRVQMRIDAALGRGASWDRPESVG